MNLLLHCFGSLTVIATVALTSAAPPATPWAPSYEGPFETHISPVALAMISKHVQLSPEQELALQRAYADHSARFAAFTAEHRPFYDEYAASLQNLGPTSARWVNIVLAAEARLAKVADEQAALDEQFLRGVQDILSEPQRSLWERFESQWLRERWVPFLGAFLEERVDILAIIEEFEADGLLAARPKELDAALSEYAGNLTRALKQREAVEIESARNRFRRDKDQWHTDVTTDRAWLGEGVGDWQERYWRQRQKACAVHRQLRDINRDAKALLDALLPEAHRALFQRRYYEAALSRYTEVNRLPARQFLDQAIEYPQLPADVREAIVESAASYELKFLALAREVVAAHTAVAESDCGSSDLDFDREDMAKAAKAKAALNAAVLRLYESEKEIIESVWKLMAPYAADFAKPEVNVPTLN